MHRLNCLIAGLVGLAIFVTAIGFAAPPLTRRSSGGYSLRPSGKTYMYPDSKGEVAGWNQMGPDEQVTALLAYFGARPPRQDAHANWPVFFGKVRDSFNDAQKLALMKRVTPEMRKDTLTDGFFKATGWHPDMEFHTQGLIRENLAKLQGALEPWKSNLGHDKTDMEDTEGYIRDLIKIIKRQMELTGYGKTGTESQQITLKRLAEMEAEVARLAKRERHTQLDILDLESNMRDVGKRLREMKFLKDDGNFQEAPAASATHASKTTVIDGRRQRRPTAAEIETQLEALEGSKK